MPDFINHPMQLIAILVLLSLLPLLVVMGTSFLKLSIVFALLRNALGVQQIPPNIAIYGLSLILTMFIMAPIGFDISSSLNKNPISLSSPHFVEQVDQQILTPYRAFLQRNTSTQELKFFSDIGRKAWPAAYQKKLDPTSLIVLLPAFTVAQLTESFKIGLLLYLPFVAIDLIVSIILLAMGMMMVSPMTISLPFKVLIFVLMNGWDKLLTQLVLSYR